MAFNQNASFAGLGTYSVIVPTAGLYFVDGKISLPSVRDGDGKSACLAVVNVNGSPVYTGVAGAEGFKTDMICAAGDTVAVVLSSAAAADQPLNVIKSNIAIGSGN